MLGGEVIFVRTPAWRIKLPTPCRAVPSCSSSPVRYCRQHPREGVLPALLVVVHVLVTMMVPPAGAHPHDWPRFLGEALAASGRQLIAASGKDCSALGEGRPSAFENVSVFGDDEIPARPNETTA